MRQWQVAVCLVVVAAVMVSVSEGGRPPYIKCESSQECGKGACCTIGMGRYSIPKCQPRRDVGEECRPYGEAANTTLSYPDGASVHLQEVYYVYCPCMEGLTCDDSEETPKCADNPLGNHLYDYGSLEDQRS